MQIDLPACRGLRGRNKHSPGTNCARTQTHGAQSADVWEGQDDLICDCGADEDRGGGTRGGVGVKGGALSFKCRLKASEAAVTLDLKVSERVSQTGVRTAVIEEFPAAARRGEAEAEGEGRWMRREVRGQ